MSSTQLSIGPECSWSGASAGHRVAGTGLEDIAVIEHPHLL